VARADEDVVARERFPELQANPGEFQAILAHNGLGGQTSFTDEQKLLIYRNTKNWRPPLRAGGDAYRFQLRTANAIPGRFFITGTIDGQGAIKVQSTPVSWIADLPGCRDAHRYPHGPVAVEDLQAGDVVWTLDRTGARVPAQC
jgi:hypothetical protein